MIKPGTIITVSGFKGFYSRSVDSFGTVWHTLTDGEQSRHWREDEWPLAETEDEDEPQSSANPLRTICLLALAVLPAILFVAQMMS